MASDTLTVTDNRTGRVYELPIANGAVRAVDLRQMKLDEEDFGLMSYDPAFLNTAATKSSITFIDGERGILRYRGYAIEQLAESRAISRPHTCCCSGSCRRRPSWRCGRTRSPTTPSCTRT